MIVAAGSSRFFGTRYYLHWSRLGCLRSVAVAAAAILAAIAWAQAHCTLSEPNSQLQFVANGMQVFSGGMVYCVWIETGEWKAISLAHASLRSWIAVSYLLVFSSLIGFTAYIWLLKATTPARASTYAYVNPVVAVFLGWLLADEVVTARMLLAMGVIISAVVLIISRQGQADPETLLQSEAAQAEIEDGLCASK